MTLENFRKIRITLDDVNKPILRKIMAKEGDFNGRELELQIIDGHEFAELKNATVTLYWKHLAMGNSGNKNFLAADRAKGIFSVTYPEAMLNAGNVLAYVSITMPGRVIPTTDFIITVEGSGFDAVAAVASNDFQALNEALLKINQYQAQIDTITADLKKRVNDLIAAEQREFDSIQSAFAPELKALQSQFDAVIAGATVDAELISARTSGVTGKSYTSAAKRIDEAEKATVVFDDTGRRFVTSFELYKGKPRLNIEEVKE